MKVTENTRSKQRASEIPVRIPLPFKDQRSANQPRNQLTLSDISRTINADTHPAFTSRKIKDQTKAKEPKPPNRESAKRCSLLLVWSVWCKLWWLHQSTPTSTCGGTQTMDNWQPRKRSTLKGATGNCGKFQNPEEVPGQIWLFYFRSFLYSWPQTKTKQTKRLHPCKAVCLDALNTFYCLRFYFILTASLCLYFAYLFSLLACKYLSIYLLIILLFHNCLYNAEFLSPNSNLKMTEERSKRRSFLSLLFITKCFTTLTGEICVWHSMPYIMHKKVPYAFILLKASIETSYAH